MQELTQALNLIETEQEATSSDDLPSLPQKRYFAIGEASELCGVKPHVLRYWEQEFTQLKPNKRRGNRRYYRYQDVIMIREIRSLLYDQGYTIEGARAQFAGQKKPEPVKHLQSLIHDILKDLDDVLSDLKSK